MPVTQKGPPPGSPSFFTIPQTRMGLSSRSIRTFLRSSSGRPSRPDGRALAEVVSVAKRSAAPIAVPPLPDPKAREDGRKARAAEDQVSADHFLVPHRRIPEPVGNDIVDVLDEYNIPVNAVQVVEQRPVAPRSEEKPTVAVPVRAIFKIDGDRVRRFALDGKPDIEAHAQAPLVKAGHPPRSSFTGSRCSSETVKWIRHKPLPLLT